MSGDGFGPLLGETPLGKRWARVLEQDAAQDRLAGVAVILTTTEPPAWAWPLDAQRAVAFVGSLTDEARAETLARLQAGSDPEVIALELRVLVLELRAAATLAALTLVSGAVREVAMLGARGDGKSIGGGIAWLLYAERHRAEGYALPVEVLVPSSTFTEHKEKLVKTLEEPLWRGLWQGSDGEHVWTAAVGGQAYVMLRLFGVEHAAEQDSLRKAADAMWIEEAAPAGVEASSGLTEDALGIGITSLRRPSYHHPVLVTSNYGSETHWTWQRYAIRQQRGTLLVRIPPGERASAADRATWLEALDGRPDLQRRLVHGEPALIVAGEAVLAGVWNPDLHVSRAPLAVIRGARTMLGHDTGLRPATVVVQEHRGQLRVLASLCTDYGGMAQHVAREVLPWLDRAGLLRRDAGTLEHRIDPAGLVGDYGNSDESPEKIIQRLLRGYVREGPSKWPPRIEPLLGVLGRMVGGQPALVVAPGPDTAVLREAAAGRWHYPRRADGTLLRDLPEKNHPHSDVGDALCYAVGALAPWRDRPSTPLPRYATSATANPYGERRSWQNRATSTTREW
ncbi:MAG TPA: hypothetical protein VE932_04985 [Patescibacteria group bacterium]|nr:hypothetical protein [Patescibacteria group bacterium]